MKVVGVRNLDDALRALADVGGARLPDSTGAIAAPSGNAQ